MAESGGVSGTLGTDAESPADGSAPETPTSLDPTAAALAAEAAKSDSELARKASAYFDKQSHLVEVQTEHLHEQRAVNLQLLKLRRFDERLRVGLRLFVILVATVIGVGAAVLLHDAVTSNQVVIEPFDTPSSLASSGLTGKVVAASLLGELNRLQAATRGSAAKHDLKNAWSTDIRLSLPEAGVSIGELSRFLKERFGDDVRIDGDLVEGEAGMLRFTVRGVGVAQTTFVGTAADIPKLTRQAAEYVYGQSEPALYAAYLSEEGRSEEALQFCQQSYAASRIADRPYLLNVWGIAVQNTGGSTPQALTLFRAAMRMKPDLWPAYVNVQNALWLLGDEEGAWRIGEEMLRVTGRRPGHVAEEYFANSDQLTWNLAALRDSSGGTENSVSAATPGPVLANVYALMHDLEAADLALRATKADPSDPTIAAISHFVRARLAAETGDTARAVAEIEAFQVDYANPIVSTEYPSYNCWVAPVEEAAGHPDGADAVLNTGGKYVDCYRFHGDILDGRGDWKGAQEWYAKSVELAPDLPAGYYSWGLTLARHGDFAAAAAKLKDANQRGPHWADPLKAWGDVLVKQNKTKDALIKYNEALKYAPNWQQLKEARAVLAK